MFSYDNDNNEEFLDIISDLLENNKVKQMKKYRQHGETSTYAHCMNVSYVSYLVSQKLGLDYKSAARGGMLHDMFLYDWREKRPFRGLLNMHAFTHPRIALKNAEKEFKLNDIEKDIIEKHMWSVTLLHKPKYKESYIVTLADKYCAMGETGQNVAKQILSILAKAKENI